MRTKVITLVLAAALALGAVTVALAMPRQEEQFAQVVTASVTAMPVMESAVLPQQVMTIGLAGQDETALPAIAQPVDDRGQVLQGMIDEGIAKKKAEEEAKRKAEEEARKKAEAEAAQKEEVVYTGSGGEVAQKALEYVGYRYVYGGSTPSGGFDCSGFTMYIYGLFDCKLSHGASYQYNKGTYVDKSSLQPGDLVFFTPWPSGSGIGHVGIYIGNDEFVHASTSTTGVIISSLNSGSYVSRYYGARRIFS